MNMYYLRFEQLKTQVFQKGLDRWTLCSGAGLCPVGYHNTYKNLLISLATEGVVPLKSRTS